MDLRTDVELEAECETCLDILKREVHPVKRAYWKARYHKAAGELWDRSFKETKTLRSFTR